MGASREPFGPLGVLSGASWSDLEVSWGALGTLKASSGRLGSLRGLLEASWKPLGGLLTTKILPKNPDRGPKTVQEAPKSLLFSTTPWELPTELKSVTLLFQVVHWIFAPCRKNGPLNFGQFLLLLGRAQKCRIPVRVASKWPSAQWTTFAR